MKYVSIFLLEEILLLDKLFLMSFNSEVGSVVRIGFMLVFFGLG